MAATWTWNGGTGDSTVPASWTLTGGTGGNSSVGPQPGDTLLIPGGEIEDALPELNGSGNVTIEAGATINATPSGDPIDLGSGTLSDETGTMTVTGSGAYLNSIGSPIGIELGDGFFSTGSLLVENGGSVRASNLTLGGGLDSPIFDGTGTVTATFGALVAVTGTLAMWNSSVLSVNSASIVGLNATNTELISLEEELNAEGVAAGGVVLVESGTLLGSGLISAKSVMNDGLIEATDDEVADGVGTLEITGSVTGTGSIAIGNASALRLDASGATSQSISFGGGSVLILNAPGTGYSGPITNLGAGDQIDFGGGLQVTSASLTSPGTVTVNTTTGTYLLTNVSFATGAGQDTFLPYTDSNGDSAIQVEAAFDTWTGSADTNFANGANWSTGTTPTVGEVASFLSNPGTVTGTGNSIELDVYQGGTWTFQGATISAAGEQDTISGVANAGFVNGNAMITGASTLNFAGVLDDGSQTGATITAQGASQVTTQGDEVGGPSTAGAGSMVLTGTNTTWTEQETGGQNGNLLVGESFDGGEGQPSAAGFLTVTNDATLNTQGYAYIGDGPDASGSVTVSSGGIWNNSFMDVGQDGGLASLVVEGGTVNTEGQSDIGQGAEGFDSSGSVFVNNLGVWNVESLQLGDDGGTGALFVNNGTVASTTLGTVIGLSGAGEATISSGGMLLHGGQEQDFVGLFAGSTGSLAIDSGGTYMFTAVATAIFALEVGVQASSSGTAAAQGSVLVTGAGALLNMGSNAIEIAEDGDGSLMVAQGGSVVATAAIAGSTAAMGVAQYGSGTVTLTDTGSHITLNGGMFVGEEGSGGLTVENNASLVVNNDTAGGGGIGIGDGTQTLLPEQSVASGFWGGTATAQVLSGGHIFTQSSITVGGNGDTGDLAVNGGTVEASTRLFIGSGTVVGTQLFNGTGYLLIGGGPGGSGVVKVDSIGISSPGTSAVQLGGLYSDAGTIAVQGYSAMLNAGTNWINIGNEGTGVLTVSDGGSVVAGTMTSADDATILGDDVGGTGSLTVSNQANYTAVGQVEVGAAGTGVVTVESFGTLDSGNSPNSATAGFVIGTDAGSSGSATVLGLGSKLVNVGQFDVGDAGLGNLSVEEGTVTTSAGMIIAAALSASGSSVNVSGIGSILQVTGSLTVGSAGEGQLSIGQGASVSGATLTLGAATGGDGVVSVNGTGTQLDVGGTTTIGDAGTGILSVLAGATVVTADLSVGTQNNGSGQLAVSGTGSKLLISGELDLGGSDLGGYGELEIGPGGYVSAAAIAPGGGPVSVVLGTFDPQVDPIAAGVTRTLQGGTDGDASGTGFIMNEGTIVTDPTKGSLASQVNSVLLGTIVGGGTLTESGAFTYDGGPTGPGLLQIGAGSVLEITGAVISGGTTTFTDDGAPSTTYTVTNSVINAQFLGTSGILQLDDIGQFGGTMTSFTGGDEIVIRTGGSAGVDTLAGLVINGNTLNFTDNGTAEEIVFGSAPAGATIVNGNTIMACFAAGTRIGTPDGLVAVEVLRVGDEVRTLLGGPGRIVWVGSRAVDCGRHPKPETVWPVRITRDAFGPGLPARALFVSPDHAIYLDEVLIPARLLINGTTVRQVKRRRVVYHHIELEQHDVVLAEGLPAESYLDTGDRAKFAGGKVTALYPEFTARTWEMRGCAELLLTGAKLAAIRARHARTEVPRRAIAG